MLIFFHRDLEKKQSYTNLNPETLFRKNLLLLLVLGELGQLGGIFGFSIFGFSSLIVFNIIIFAISVLILQ